MTCHMVSVTMVLAAVSAQSSTVPAASELAGELSEALSPSPPAPPSLQHPPPSTPPPFPFSPPSPQPPSPPPPSPDLVHEIEHDLKKASRGYLYAKIATGLLTVLIVLCAARKWHEACCLTEEEEGVVVDLHRTVVVDGAQVAAHPSHFLGKTGVYNSWHRYTDFKRLDEEIAPQLGLGDFPVPKRPLFSDEQKAGRAQELQAYLRGCVRVAKGARAGVPPALKAFLFTRTDASTMKKSESSVFALV